MKIKTSELTGVALDYAAALIEGRDYWRTETAGRTHAPRWTPDVFTPSTDWAQGGPIIERELIALEQSSTSAYWVARRTQRTLMHPCFRQEGATPLIAAMRCYVQSKLGDEVEIPEALS